MLALALLLTVPGVARGDGADVAAGQAAERTAQRGALPAAPLKQVVVEGARYFSNADIVSFLKLRLDGSLPRPADELAEALRERYADNGYWFARVQARFDEPAGRLTFDVDEGRIDGVEFLGVSGRLASEFTQDFALQPGDVFREAEASHALSLLLQPTEGAVQPDRRTTTHGLGRSVRMPFEMLDRNGKRVLAVHLATERTDFNLALGTEGREDWFDPVDGFAPAVGFNETIFDPGHFNHTYITGYVSYKFGPDRAGYSLGFERPFVARPRLFLGAELHDQTASDDLWRLSQAEQSLASAGLKATFRDYYRRRGYQLNASVQLSAGQEILAAWRDERQEPLTNTTDFSVFRDDRVFRPNMMAEAGRLHAFVFGYVWDSRGLRDELRTTRYERHQMADLFGSWGGEAPGWRVEATAELAARDLGGDFDYRRYVLNVRRYTRLSPHNTLNVRAIAAAGQGTLPPQRVLSLGGVGSLPGYDFKEAAGERMLLVSAEYRYRLGHDIHALMTYDGGRVFRPVVMSRADWMQSIGTGLEFGRSFRLQVFWPLETGRPAQFVVRLRPTF